jgi:hypothetical protein
MSSDKEFFSCHDHPSPVWVLPQNRYGSNRWIAYSPKLKRAVILYSDLEYDHWVLVEATSSIKSFCEQPRRVRIQLPSGLVTTVFDMWILWDSGRQEYREVKYRHELQNAVMGSRVRRQIEAQKKWCEIDRVDHTIMTDELIRANPIFLANWKIILSHLACTQAIDYRSHIESVEFLLQKNGGSTLRDIERSFTNADRTLIRASVFSLIHRGHLKASLDAHPLDALTKIEVVQ